MSKISIGKAPTYGQACLNTQGQKDDTCIDLQHFVTPDIPPGTEHKLGLVQPYS